MKSTTRTEKLYEGKECCTCTGHRGRLIPYIGWGLTRLSSLANKEELAILGNCLDNALCRYGMEISAEKTKLMTNSH